MLLLYTKINKNKYPADINFIGGIKKLNLVIRYKIAMQIVFSKILTEFRIATIRQNLYNGKFLFFFFMKNFATSKFFAFRAREISNFHYYLLKNYFH